MLVQDTAQALRKVGVGPAARHKWSTYGSARLPVKNLVSRSFAYFRTLAHRVADLWRGWP